MIYVCASRLLTCYWPLQYISLATFLGKSWSWRTLELACVRAPNDLLHKYLHQNKFNILPLFDDDTLCAQMLPLQKISYMFSPCRKWVIINIETLVFSPCNKWVITDIKTLVFSPCNKYIITCIYMINIWSIVLIKLLIWYLK